MLAVYLTTKLNRENITKNALILSILKRGTKNLTTQEAINIKLEELPEGAKEGSILTFKEGKFILNQEKEREVSKRIKEKMDNLWNN